jgi:hypothetical protein
MILPTLVAVFALSADDPPPPLVEAERPQVKTTRSEAIPPPPSDGGPEQRVGAVFAPAIMPRGSMAVYGLLGAPDVGAGYRQGFSRFELEARLWLNYLEASAALEIGGKISAYRRGILEFVPNVGLGVEANSGSRYYDKANFAYVALRPRAALVTGIRFTETATGIFLVDLPWSIALTNGGAGGHFSPTMGFGAELALSSTMSGLLLGQLGIDVIKEPLGVTQIRPAWAVRLGLGFRLF